MMTLGSISCAIRLLALLAGTLHVAEAAGLDKDGDDAGGLIEHGMVDAEAEPIEPPALQPALVSALDAGYLTEAERRELRVFHGLWTASDLEEDPALAERGDMAARKRRARAALIARDYLDPVFERAGVVYEAAEAALGRGDADAAERAVRSIAMESTWRNRVLGDIAALRGERLAAGAAYERALAAMRGLERAEASEIVEGARALRGLVRHGFREDQGAAYQRMMRWLSVAHQERDRLYWPALVVEAEVLAEKGKRGEAAAAALDALSLNPRAAGAWAVLGTLSAGGFDRGRAEAIASRLEGISRGVGDADEASVSIDAALIRSLERVRADDPEMAWRALEPALSAAPGHPALLARAAGVAALGYEVGEIEAALSAFEAVRPGAADALHEVGRTLAFRRQYGMASEYLGRAVEREPWWSDPVTELGLMELQAGRDEAALVALERAVELDPFNDRAENSLALVRTLMGWGVEESEHFRVRYKPGGDGVLAREMLDALESTHESIVEALDHEPPRKTAVELLPDNEWFGVRVTGMPGLFTVAASTGPVVAMESPREGPLHTGEYNWLQVFRHEYVHTVTLSMTRNRIPHWFTEAAAVHLEDVPREGRRWSMLTEAWVSGGLFGPESINLGFIRPETPQDRSLAYAQSEWMYEFMLDRWGDEAPRLLMLAYAEGMREGEAFERVLGVDPGDFHRLFREWAGEELLRVGMVSEPSVASLVVDETLGDLTLRDASLAWMSAGACAVACASSGVDAGGVLEGSARPDMVVVDDLVLRMWLEERPAHAGLLGYAVDRWVEADGEGRLDAEEVGWLERFAAARPVSPVPHRLLARHWLAVGEAERAESHLAFLDAREVSSNAYAVELAQRAAARGDWAESLRYVERATRVSPFDANLRELAAEAAIRGGLLERARHHVLALRDLEPGRAVHGERLEAIERLLARGSAEGG